MSVTIGLKPQQHTATLYSEEAVQGIQRREPEYEGTGCYNFGNNQSFAVHASESIYTCHHTDQLGPSHPTMNGCQYGPWYSETEVK